MISIESFFVSLDMFLSLSILEILFTALKKNRSLIKSIAKRMNQKITIIGKINKGYKKNLIKQPEIVFLVINILFFSFLNAPVIKYSSSLKFVFNFSKISYL